MNGLLKLFKMIFPPMHLGLGGGGSQPKIPEKTTQTNINIPPFIQPYVESMLGKTQALTSGAQYEPFDPSKRFAGVDPMQQQSYDRAGSMGTAPELDLAGQYAGQAMQTAGQASQHADPLMYSALGLGAGAANMGNQYNQMAQDPGALQGFMSPYMQNVVDMQKQEATRDYMKQLPQMQAGATNAGAYGGSRHAIMEAEGQRNLSRQLGDIQTAGSQQAYEQALKNMQFGSDLGMQGYQTGLQGVGQGINAAQLGLQGASTQMQGAGVLGQLGQTRYGQEMGITELMNAMGGQRQAHEQQAKDFDYQQFMDELNFPYQQLSFMSDMTHGLPLSQSTVYENKAGPNPTSQLLGAGLQAYGLANRAQGGMVPKPKGYAQGGQVDGQAFGQMDTDEVSATLAMLSDEQLMQYAQTVEDAIVLSLIQSEMQRRERTREPQAQMPESTVAQDIGGLAQLQQQQQMAQQQPDPAMQQQMMQQQPQQMPMMYGGGLVALASGGHVTPGTRFKDQFKAASQAERELSPEDLKRMDRLGLKAPLSAAKDVFVGGPYNALHPLWNKAIDSRIGRALGVDDTTLSPIGGGGATPFYDAEIRGPRDRIMNPPPPAPDAPFIPGVSGATEGEFGAGPEWSYEDGLRGPGDVQTVDLIAEQEAAEAARQAGIFGPLEESVRAAALAGQAPKAGPQAAAGQAPQGGGQRQRPIESTLAAVVRAPESAYDHPESFDAYLNAIDEKATQSLEEKMAVDAMKAGLDERQAQLAVRENRGKMDALIAAGAAMMSGRTLGEGLALGSQAGVTALREATAAQEQLEDGLSQAMLEQQRYETALRKDNKKMAQDAYSSYLNHSTQVEQFAETMKFNQMKLGQEMQIAQMNNASRIAAAGMRGGKEGNWATVEARVAGSPEAAHLKEVQKLAANPATALHMPKNALSDAQRDVEILRAKFSVQEGLPGAEDRLERALQMGTKPSRREGFSVGR